MLNPGASCGLLPCTSRAPSTPIHGDVDIDIWHAVKRTLDRHSSPPTRVVSCVILTSLGHIWTLLLSGCELAVRPFTSN